jgi:putative nucleotidyltransferase with HDIG domain
MTVEKSGVVVLKETPALAVRERLLSSLPCFAVSTSRQSLATALQASPCALVEQVSAVYGQSLANDRVTLGPKAVCQAGDSAVERSTLSEAPSKTLPRFHSEPHDSESASPAEQAVGLGKKARAGREAVIGRVADVNKELWLILSMLLLVGIMNYLITAQRMLLGLYTLPTVFSAYYYGRRHATLTAFASILLVGITMYLSPQILSGKDVSFLEETWWCEITAWGSILLVTAYAMGSLYERNRAQLQELRSTYYGLLMILRNFVSQDKYTENHCYRVSLYASKIAGYYGCNSQQVEDIRAAALLHDIGKLDISRELLYKAARFSMEESEKMKEHVHKGLKMLEPLEGPLGRVIPIILAHHDKYDGSGYHPAEAENIPVEARILSVADVYDALVSDRPYRKAMSPFEAKDVIVRQAGSEFDPTVVKAFVRAFNKGQLEIPSVIV